MKNFLTDAEMDALVAKDAPDFISDEEMEKLGTAAEPKQTAKPTISTLESAARGLVQGATFGFSDEIAGGIDWLLSKTGDLLVPEGLKNPYANEKGGDIYRRGRNESRARDAAAREANPKAYVGGEIAGSAATMAIPGLAAANGATTAGVAARAAAAGALSGTGLSEEEDLSGVALDAAKGAALGGVMGAAGDKLSKALRRTPEALKDVANDRTQAALGFTRASTKAARKVNKNLPDEIAEFARKNKMITAGATAEDIAERNLEVRKAAGEAMEKVYQVLDGQGVETFSPADVVERLTKEIAEPLAGKETSRASYNHISRVIKDIASYGDGPIPLKKAAELKAFLQDQVRRTGGFKSPNPSEKNTILRDALKIVTSEIDEAAGRGARLLGDQGLVTRLQNARKAYGITKQIEDLVENRIAQSSNKLFGLTDTIAAGGAFAADPLAVVPVVLAKKISEKYGNNVAALTADKLSSLLKNNQKYFKIFEKVSPRGAPAIVLTHEWLSKNDPEYQNALEGE